MPTVEEWRCRNEILDPVDTAIEQQIDRYESSDVVHDIYDDVGNRQWADFFTIRESIRGALKCLP